MKALRLVWTLTAKDLRIEYRSRQAFLTTVFFALLILIIFNFAFDPGDNSVRAAAAGILWVSLLFPGVIQLNRSKWVAPGFSASTRIRFTFIEPGLPAFGEKLVPPRWTVVRAIPGRHR